MYNILFIYSFSLLILISQTRCVRVPQMFFTKHTHTILHNFKLYNLILRMLTFKIIKKIVQLHYNFNFTLIHWTVNIRN